MKEIRPRLPARLKDFIEDFRNLSKSRAYQLFRRKSNYFRLLVMSDIHGILIDRQAFDCVLKVIKDNHFDEIVINGDLLDLPYLSNHFRQIRRINDNADLLRNYSEVEEIEFVKRNILNKIRKATEAKILFRLGNHDERLVKPKSYNKDQLERLNEVFIAYDSSDIRRILDLEKYQIHYDPEPVTDYFDQFAVVHGLSLAKSAPDKNIREFMGSGTTGHTHRLNSRYFTNRGRFFCWLESGCLRLKDEVEYFPTAKVADWQQGFVTVSFDLEKKIFFAKTHAIINGSCEFDGILY